MYTHAPDKSKQASRMRACVRERSSNKQPLPLGNKLPAAIANYTHAPIRGQILRSLSTEELCTELLPLLKFHTREYTMRLCVAVVRHRVV